MQDFNLYQYYKSAKKNNIMLYFKGAVSQEILVEIGLMIRNKFSVEKQIKKIFGVFIELAQNIMHYSTEIEYSKRDNINTGIGIILFTETEDEFQIIAGNQIENSKEDSIINKINIVNSMNQDQLKEYYKTQLRSNSENAEESGSKGAGLGFIDMARKSKNKIEYDITEIDKEKSFLELTVRFNKDNG
jgi:Family of unknown function (DUF6272)